jgi:hypothetical protein
MGSNKAAIEFQTHVDNLVKSIEDGTLQKEAQGRSSIRVAAESLAAIWERYDLPGDIYMHAWESDKADVSVRLSMEQALELAEILRDHLRRT